MRESRWRWMRGLPRAQDALKRRPTAHEPTLVEAL
jgi:hypothetical protein